MSTVRAASDVLSQQLQAALRERVSRYIDVDDHRSVQLCQLRHTRFPNSQIYRFYIACGERSRHLVVKVPGARNSAQDAGRRIRQDRPRLFPKPDLATKAHLEYVTLARIDQHFRRLNDRRFGTLEIFDYLEAQRALVMDEVSAPTLEDLLLECLKRKNGAQTLRRLVLGFRNAGAWLRTYHDLPPLGHTQVRHSTLDQFKGSLLGFAEFVVRAGTDPNLVNRIEGILRRCDDAVEPRLLPLGMAHSDYVPRNLFVGAAGEVTVFDSVGRWQSPIFEDLSRFVVATDLLAARFQQLKAVSELLGVCRRAFLTGYFGGDSIPQPLMNLFTLQALLDRWVGLLYSCRQARGIRRLAKQYRALDSASLIRSKVAQALFDLERMADEPLAKPTASGPDMLHTHSPVSTV